jgi:hypothetical protein
VASYVKSRIFLNNTFTGPSGVCTNVGFSLSSGNDALMGKLIALAMGMPVITGATPAGIVSVTCSELRT